jgi:hypothetical protein
VLCRRAVYYANGFNTPWLVALHFSVAGIEPTLNNSYHNKLPIFPIPCALVEGSLLWPVLNEPSNLQPMPARFHRVIDFIWASIENPKLTAALTDVNAAQR